MTERFIVDDCGTLIDMESRNTYDYVSDVCGLLNELHEENMRLRKEVQGFIKGIQDSSKMSAEAIMKGRDPYDM